LEEGEGHAHPRTRRLDITHAIGMDMSIRNTIKPLAIRD
jgi:hypothetical protein